MGSLGRHRRRMHGTARSVRRTGRNRSDAQSVGGTPPIREPDWLERLVGEIGTLFKDCLGTPEVQEEPPLKGILKWPSKESSTDSASSSDNEKKAIDGNKGGPPRRITFNQAIQVELVPKTKELFCNQASWFSTRVLKTTCFYSQRELGEMRWTEIRRKFLEMEREAKEEIKMEREDTRQQEKRQQRWGHYDGRIAV